MGERVWVLVLGVRVGGWGGGGFSGGYRKMVGIWEAALCKGFWVWVRERVFLVGGETREREGVPVLREAVWGVGWG